jgi:hypothetical protein
MKNKLSVDLACRVSNYLNYLNMLSSISANNIRATSMNGQITASYATWHEKMKTLYFCWWASSNKNGARLNRKLYH